MDCHCRSGKDFTACCGPYLTKEKTPPTAEALMRSRYCAYVTADMDYLEDTQTFEEGQFDKEGALKWAKESDWKGLEIVSTKKGLEGDSTGVVEFIARYSNKKGIQAHHEVSSFVYQDKWLFKSGQNPELKTIKREAPKVGRNDPCPCGSGKKFKKCCG